jgi:hypothetical protein
MPGTRSGNRLSSDTNGLGDRLRVLARAASRHVADAGKRTFAGLHARSDACLGRCVSTTSVARDANAMWSAGTAQAVRLARRLVDDESRPAHGC